jgi:heavy metal sensor kinase
VTNGEVRYVQIAELTNPIDSTLQELRRNLIIGSIMATIVLTLGAWLIADASLRPLSSMSGTARRIGRTSDLSQRIDPPETRDEVEYLAETFNDMLARLEETFNAQRRFVADASHELRTPLTALRANADIMLRQIESGLGERSDLLEGLEDVRDEVDRMTRLVQNLLTLARADVGWRPEMETVELANVVRDAARVASPLSQGHLLRLDVPDDDDADDARVYGNEDQIRQLILILLDNAFTYTPSGTEVRLSLRTEDGEAVIRVSDDGPGIPPQHLQNVFERFYRADASRARSSGGSGLGLAIARWIVTIHNGSIEAASDESDGTVFTIRLPMVEDEAPRPTGLLRRSRAESALAGS